MQTFLPYPDFRKSLECLDYRRLGKQRVESFQILKTLSGQSDAWKNHPAVKMWRRFEDSLSVYYNLSLEVWEKRGYKNIKLKPLELKKLAPFPEWFGDDRFHKSHRSNLLRKNPEWYSQFGWTESNDLPYFWPVT